MLENRDTLSDEVQGTLALALRVGLGLVFIIGGTAKLERLLTPSKADAIVTEYLSPLGYINQTFNDWLFAGPLGSVLTPWSFLTTLSAFELIAGIMLVVGLMVRPLSVAWALLLWTFVISLPVVTTPGVKPPAPTHMSPAELVQARDIALSGLFFVLYNLGSGTWSLDASRFGLPRALGRDWSTLGLLARLSMGLVFVIGGFFAGFSKIVTFGMPGWLLVIIGLGLVSGTLTRIAAAVAAAVLVWFLIGKIGGATSVIGYFNSVKREFALLAASGCLVAVGGGTQFAIDKIGSAIADWAGTYFGGRSAAPAHRSM